jgi:hypothetical protein
MWWFGKQIKHYIYIKKTIDVFEKEWWIYEWYVDRKLVICDTDLIKVECATRSYVAWYIAAEERYTGCED